MAPHTDYGVGAVVSQKDEKRVERPIAFASKALNKHQRNYSVIEKEALAAIFGIKKFNEYFHLITDHKPLIQLFNMRKKLPEGTAKKLQRWALFLSDYNFQIHYRPTTKHGNADALSRLPMGPDLEFDESEESCHQVDEEDWEILQEFPVTAKTIALATDRDCELKQVRDFVKNGWPRRLLRSNASWYLKRDRLSVKAGVLLLSGEQGTRVVVPVALREQILKMLHEGHWGIVNTNQLARRYCYWREMDKDIQNLVKKCSACQLNQSAPRQDWVSWPKPRPSGRAGLRVRGSHVT